MRAALSWFRELLSRAWARPDELMLQFGAGGELLVARVRAVLSALVLLLPLLHAASGGDSIELMIGLGAAVVVNVMAQVWLALARRRRLYRWLPYATGTYDVTATTGVLALLAWSDPVASLNSMVVWAFYLIAITMTALRNDVRLTLYVGGLAIVQFAVLAALVLGGADSPEALMSADYGTASASSVTQRLVLLLMMTLLTSAVVFRMQRLIELSGNDGLTGLPNRSWLLQRMPGLYEALQRDGGSLSLALLDVDNFRRVNDAAGHLDGDRAIRHVAQMLKGMLREDEHVVRLGGQEFVLLLRCPIGSAWERCERIRRELAGRPFASERNADVFTLTFSGGLASWPQDGADTRSLLSSADRRLQAAKHAGRNRVLARDV
jgi:two-component system cell cycle response regulator